MGIRCLYAFIPLLVSPALSSCGTAVPLLQEPWEENDVKSRLVYRIQKSIYCELRFAISELGSLPATRRSKTVDSIPDDWGVQTTLQLQVDETGQINPSATAIPSSHFSLPLTAQLSSQATRIDKYYSFYSVKDMKKSFIKGESCDFNQSPLNREGTSRLLSGNLGIRNWLEGALDAKNSMPSSQFPNSMATKLDVLSYDVKFILISSGTANPSISLSTAITGGGLPLFSQNRTRTHDLLLTLGPTVIEKVASGRGNVTSPSLAASNLHASGEIQQSFSSALQTLNPTLR
ncbi:hypothetical protein IHEIED_04583 [Methylorubrum populi]